ncbi:uncharacterized protein [Macrobrachium rosenbergii]|uniref:uncharacterized protein isoform X2 n=1 Tax=Macrobrachium rosenbergii TaxID=79674 RepID=UPI0034D61AE3
MHWFERTLWLFFVVVVCGVYVQTAPTEEQTAKPANRTAVQKDRRIDFGDDFNPSAHIPFETTTVVGPLNLEMPLQRLPPIMHTGPGKYLEDRRRQTEARIQELQEQVDLLIEAQKSNGTAEIVPDPERDARTAIQYGLNCERGDTIIICLMKKVVVLRREVSGIQRDVSVLGKKFVDFQIDLREMNLNKEKTGGGPDQDEPQKEYGSGDADGYDPSTDFDNTTANGTTEAPFDIHQDPLCPPRFERVGSICYYVVTDRVSGVTSARDFCQAHGGYLARPRDSLTIHDLANHLTRLYDKESNQLSELWVDGQYQAEKDTWKWSDGVVINRSIWGISDTPTKSHRAGTCVLLKKELNYLAMAQDCEYHYFFVCQAETRDDIPAM